MYHTHLALLRQPCQPLGEFADDRFFPRPQLIEFYGRLVENDALVRRFLCFGDDFRHMQQRLGGDTSNIEAYTAECGIALDQDHFPAQIGGAERAGIAARPRSQYHYIGMNIALWNIRRRSGRRRC